MSGDVASERALWQSVVNRALVDALWPAPYAGHLHGSGVAIEQKDEARRWIGSRNFRRVCWLAGYDPQFILDRVRPLLTDDAAAARFVQAVYGSAHQRARMQLYRRRAA